MENIYDLHRLTRRQHHLEGICEDKEAYRAELQELLSPQGGQEEAATGGSPEKVAEVLFPRWTHVCRNPDSACIILPLRLALESLKGSMM